jgi:hypothetical protein
MDRVAFRKDLLGRVRAINPRIGAKIKGGDSPVSIPGTINEDSLA